MPRPKPAIIFIFVTLFLDVFGFGLVIPILPRLVEQLQGGGAAAAAPVVAWMLSLFALMQFIFSPVLGSLSDHFGRRPVILLSLLGSGLDYLLLAWAPSLGWLFLGRLISGITSSNFSAASAYIADITPPEKRAAGFGIIGAAFGLGFSVAPAIGGWLGDIGLRVPFVMAASVTLLNWLYGALVLPESLGRKNRRVFTWASSHPVRALRSLSHWPLVAGLAGAIFLLNLAHNIYPSLWVLYTGQRYGWTSHDVGISLSLVGIMAAIVQAGLAGRILAVIGERAGVYLEYALMSVIMVCYGLATHGWMIYALIFVGSINNIGNPAAQALISKAVPPDQQGAVQGSMNSLMSIANIVAPLMWGSLFAWSIAPGHGTFPGLSFMMAGGVMAMALFLAWRTFQKHPPADQAADTTASR